MTPKKMCGASQIPSKSEPLKSQAGVRLFSQIKGNSLKLFQGRFRLDMREKFFMEGVVQPWNRLHRAAVRSPSLDVFKTHVDVPGFPGNLVNLAGPSRPPEAAPQPSTAPCMSPRLAELPDFPSSSLHQQTLHYWGNRGSQGAEIPHA